MQAGKNLLRATPVDALLHIMEFLEGLEHVHLLQTQKYYLQMIRSLFEEITHHPEQLVLGDPAPAMGEQKTNGAFQSTQLQLEHKSSPAKTRNPEKEETAVHPEPSEEQRKLLLYRRFFKVHGKRLLEHRRRILAFIQQVQTEIQKAKTEILQQPTQLLKSIVDAEALRIAQSNITNKQIMQIAEAFFFIANTNAEVMFIKLFSELPLSAQQRQQIVNRSHGPDQLTCLHVAAKNRNPTLTKFLLDQGADPATLCTDQNFPRTAFCIACSTGNIPVLQTLIESTLLPQTLQAGQPRIFDSNFYPNFYTGPKYIYYLDSHHTRHDDPQWRVSTTALATAVREGHVAAVIFLIDFLNTLIKDRPEEAKALIVDSYFSEVIAVAIAIPNVKTRLAMVAVLLTYSNSKQALEKPIPSNCPKFSVFLLATKYGPPELLELLKKAGSNMLAVTSLGKNALHFAAESNNDLSDEKEYGEKQVAVIRWLLEQKDSKTGKPLFDVQAQDNWQDTALLLAVKHGCYPAAKYLMSIMTTYHINHMGGNYGGDILCMAVCHGRNHKQRFLDFLKFLLPELKRLQDRQAHLKSLNDALSWAVDENTYTSLSPDPSTSRETVRMLLAAGADPLTKCIHTRGPLYMMVFNRLEEYDNREICEFQITVSAAFFERITLTSPETATKYLRKLCERINRNRLQDPVAIAAAVTICTQLLKCGAVIFGAEDDTTSRPIICLMANTHHREILQTLLRYGLKNSAYAIYLNYYIFRNTLPENRNKPRANIAVLFDAFFSIPLGANNYCDGLLLDPRVKPNFPELREYFKAMETQIKNAREFQEKNLLQLIQKELLYLQPVKPHPKHKAVKSKDDSSEQELQFIGTQPKTVEAKLNPPDAKQDNRFSRLWKYNPEDPKDRAEKNVIFALLVKYLRLPNGKDPLTFIDVFNIVEMGIKQAERTSWLWSSTAEYAAPLKALIMNPNGEMFFPFKFRNEIIQELINEFHAFYALLRNDEKQELEELLERVCPETIAPRVLPVAKLLLSSSSGSPDLKDFVPPLPRHHLPVIPGATVTAPSPQPPAVISHPPELSTIPAPSPP